MDLYLDIFKRLNSRVCRRAIAQVGNGNAVQRIVIAAACAATERKQRRVGLILLPVELSIAGGNDRRHRYPDHEGVAPWSGQCLQG